MQLERQNNHEQSAWEADQSSKECHGHSNHHVVELDECGCKTGHKRQCLESRPSKEASGHATHHVVELGECGCKSLMTDIMPKEQTRQ